MIELPAMGKRDVTELKEMGVRLPSPSSLASELRSGFAVVD